MRLSIQKVLSGLGLYPVKQGMGQKVESGEGGRDALRKGVREERGGMGGRKDGKKEEGEGGRIYLFIYCC